LGNYVRGLRRAFSSAWFQGWRNTAKLLTNYESDAIFLLGKGEGLIVHQSGGEDLREQLIEIDPGSSAVGHRFFRYYRPDGPIGLDLPAQILEDPSQVGAGVWPEQHDIGLAVLRQPDVERHIGWQGGSEDRGDERRGIQQRYKVPRPDAEFSAKVSQLEVHVGGGN